MDVTGHYSLPASVYTTSPESWGGGGGSSYSSHLGGAGGSGSVNVIHHNGSPADMHRRFLEKEVSFQKTVNLSKLTPADVAGMFMAEYAAYLKQTKFGTDYNTKPVSPFQHWKDNRDKFIKDEITDIDKITMYVTLDETRYDDVAQEDNGGIYQHRISRSRWSPRRWLASRRNRRDLGRYWDWQDDFGSALRKRPGAPTGGSLDRGGF